MDFLKGIMKRINKFDFDDFDFDDIEWDSSLLLKIGIGFAVLIVAFWIISSVISFAISLAPYIILAFAIYLGYRVFTSEKEDKETVIPKAKRKEKQIREERYEAAFERSEVIENLPVTETKRKVKNEPVAEFVEPDLDRLAEKENEAPQIDDSVLDMIEERKRRLGK